jgi:ribokinase
LSVIVLGSANLDWVFRVARIPAPGETLLATSVQQHPGGKGNNQVIAVARAGADVEFIAAIGQDAAGEQLVGVLHASGVGDRIRRVAEPTGMALITVEDSGQNTIIVHSGANSALLRLTAAEREAIADADYLLLQLETPLDTVVAAARTAAAASTRVVLNASPIRELPADLLEAVDVLLVNEFEAVALAGHPQPQPELSVGSAQDLATFLLRTFEAVVITLGDRGAVVADRTTTDAAHVPAARVAVVDTTGAGDTFAGALVAALSRGEGLIDAARFASAAGALAVGRTGAVPSIPMRADIEAFTMRLGI